MGKCEYFSNTFEYNTTIIFKPSQLSCMAVLEYGPVDRADSCRLPEEIGQVALTPTGRIW